MPYGTASSPIVDPNLQLQNEYNMAALHVRRIHLIISEIEFLDAAGYISGQSVLAREMKLLKNWYYEMSGLMDGTDNGYARTTYLVPFAEKPIINTGTSHLVPISTELLMEDFKVWLFAMMYKYRILTKLGVDPAHVRY